MQVGRFVFKEKELPDKTPRLLPVELLHMLIFKGENIFAHPLKGGFQGGGDLLSACHPDNIGARIGIRRQLAAGGAGNEDLPRFGNGMHAAQVKVSQGSLLAEGQRPGGILLRQDPGFQVLSRDGSHP